MKTHYMMYFTEYYDGSMYEKLIRITGTVKTKGIRWSTYEIYNDYKKCWTAKKPQFFPKYIKELSDKTFDKNDDVITEYRLRELNMKEDAELIIEHEITYGLFQ